MKPGTLMAHMTIHGVVILVIGDHAMAKPNGKLRRMTALMLTFLDRQWVLRE